MPKLLERLRMPRHWGKNTVIVAALVSVGFTVAWLRFRPYLGSEGSYTDGVRTYEVTSPGQVRYAVWDDPEPFPGEVNGPETEGRASLSPDGRVVVFSVGERGLGSDLWVAEMIDGRATEPEPLSILNTAADELAPVFAGGALYFASDRGGTVGGLDLWRARYDRGRFEAPERLGGGINSSADDTDPAPMPGSESIVFASTRASRGPLEDFDLFLARPVRDSGGVTPEGEVPEEGMPDGGWSVEPIAALNSGFQDREPAFTTDGAALFFASDRSGGAGGFDLYRSTIGLEGEALAQRWLDPEPVVGLNGPDEERAPSPAPDGFALVYSGGVGGESTDLFRARSLELFRSPGKPVGWRELIFVLVLILIALLAWLAKRWEQLEVVYKCFLISALVHLFLLFYFREVYPESPEYELRGGEDRVRVRLVADASQAAANEERGGQLAAARSEDSQEEARPERAESAEAEFEATSAPAAAEFARAARPSASAPERLQSATERSLAQLEPTPVDVRAPAEQMERRRGEAAELQLEAQTSSAAPADVMAARVDGAAPERAASADAPVALEVRPDALALERSEAGAADARPIPARVAVGNRVARSTPTQTESSVRAPSESFERRDDRSGLRSESTLAAAPAPGAFEMEREGQAHELQRDAGAAPGSEALMAATSVAPGAASLERASAERLDFAPLAQAESNLDGPTSTRSEQVAVDVAAPTSNGPMHVASAETAPTAIDLTPSSGREEPTRALDLEASRFARTERTVSAEMPTLTPRSFSGIERATPTRPEPTPARMQRMDPGQIARAEVPRPQTPTLQGGFESEREAPRRSEVAAEVDFTADLLDLRPSEDRAAPQRGVGSDAPSRFSASNAIANREVVLEPLVARARVVPDAEGRRERERWDHTPYQSRSGENKVRALELHGGSEETERAVAAGLEYLAGIQKPEGYWGSANDRHEKYGHVVVGKTGLALLAFMGAGHTSGSGSEHEATVRRAIDFLIAIQDEETGHFGYCTSYGHGIATYSLAEAYALTQEDRLRPVLERAVQQILRHQKSSRDERFDGGWSYYYPDGRTFDRWPRASITAWQVMALESARLGGLEVPDEAFEGAERFLRGSWDRDREYFRYSHDPSRLNSNYATLPGSTPASLFALSLLGEDVSHRRWRDARRFLEERSPSGYRSRGADAFVHRAEGNLYFWYYGTLALFRVGGDEWRRWNVAMQETLLPAQEEDGSWRPISIYAKDYAKDRSSDRSYSTAMSVLTLEIYYRYFTPLLQVK